MITFFTFIDTLSMFTGVFGLVGRLGWVGLAVWGPFPTFSYCSISLFSGLRFYGEESQMGLKGEMDGMFLKNEFNVEG